MRRNIYLKHLLKEHHLILGVRDRGLCADAMLRDERK